MSRIWTHSLVCALLCSSALQLASATTGVDVSAAVLPASWKCLKGDGKSFGIIRCYQSIGRADPNCPHTIYNAWDGGMSHVDIYMFPDPHAGNPEGQVDDMIAYLAKFRIHAGGTPPASYGMVWLDIEGPQYWGSVGSNQAFFDGLVKQLEAKGQHIGVYTSKSQWDPIMGSSTAGSRFPLWYAHYDGRPSFSDFEAFGGWTHPSIKQYDGDKSECSSGVDLNWYPDGGHPVFNATRKGAVSF